MWLSTEHPHIVKNLQCSIICLFPTVLYILLYPIHTVIVVFWFTKENIMMSTVVIKVKDNYSIDLTSRVLLINNEY